MLLCLLAATSIGLPGCSEPLKDDRAHDIMETCCAATRDQVTSVKDVESNRFREYCNMCRKGKSKGDCGHGARRVLLAVARTYSADVLPGECSTMHSQLKEMGIEFEKP